MGPLEEIAALAEKALCEKGITYKLQKLLSQIIVKARTYEIDQNNSGGEKQG